MIIQEIMEGEFEAVVDLVHKLEDIQRYKVVVGLVLVEFCVSEPCIDYGHVWSHGRMSMRILET